MGAREQALALEPLEVAADRGRRDTELLCEVADVDGAAAVERLEDDREALGAVHAYLTLPAVSPLTRYFSIEANRITTGTIAIAEAANRYCHCVWLSPMKPVIPSVSGWRLGVLMRVRAITYSFQAAMNEKITEVTIP